MTSDKTDSKDLLSLSRRYAVTLNLIQYNLFGCNINESKLEVIYVINSV